MLMSGFAIGRYSGYGSFGSYAADSPNGQEQYLMGCHGFWQYKNSASISFFYPVSGNDCVENVVC
jgi:hypothetical protein